MALTEALSKVCRFQKGYSKTPEEFEDLLEGILFICSEHKMEDIIDGLRVYVRNHSDIPAPNDILDVIDPQFKPDKALYSRLCQKRRQNGIESMSQKELKYMEIYEMEKTKEIL